MNLLFEPPLWVSLKLIGLSAGIVIWHLWRDYQAHRAMGRNRRALLPPAAV